MPASTRESAAPFVPEDRTLPALRKAVRKCHGCDLYRNATQAVFGELETGAAAKKPQVAIMMIGEQPGDHEDREGRPFVGPAGKLLDKCLEDVGIDRHKVYVTNTVKHFKWEPRGKLRISKKPSMKEIHACRPWLEAELETVRPKLIVCLGAVAAQSLLDPSFKITQTHGTLQAGKFPRDIPPEYSSRFLRAFSMGRTDAVSAPGIFALSQGSARQDPLFMRLGGGVLNLWGSNCRQPWKWQWRRWICPNTYACGLPGTFHGPFKSEHGCLLLEVHIYDDGRDSAKG